MASSGKSTTLLASLSILSLPQVASFKSQSQYKAFLSLGYTEWTFSWATWSELFQQISRGRNRHDSTTPIVRWLKLHGVKNRRTPPWTRRIAVSVATLYVCVLEKHKNGKKVFHSITCCPLLSNYKKSFIHASINDSYSFLCALLKVRVRWLLATPGEHAWHVCHFQQHSSQGKCSVRPTTGIKFFWRNALDVHWQAKFFAWMSVYRSW